MLLVPFGSFDDDDEETSIIMSCCVAADRFCTLLHLQTHCAIDQPNFLQGLVLKRVAHFLSVLVPPPVPELDIFFPSPACRQLSLIMATMTETQTKTTTTNGSSEQVVPRLHDQEYEQHLSNAKLGMFQPGKIPYTHAQTYVAPDGSRENYYKATEGANALQRHIIFFDGSLSGVCRPIDTYLGFYAIGFGVILSTLAVFIIHSSFAYPTQPVTGSWRDWIPDPTFKIHIANIHKDKHTDSGSFDKKGNLRHHKIEQNLKEFSTKLGRDAFSFHDMAALIYGRYNLLDFYGTTAMVLEWAATYYLVWPKSHYVTKDQILVSVSL